MCVTVFYELLRCLREQSFHRTFPTLYLFAKLFISISSLSFIFKNLLFFFLMYHEIFLYQLYTHRSITNSIFHRRQHNSVTRTKDCIKFFNDKQNWIFLHNVGTEIRQQIKQWLVNRQEKKQLHRLIKLSTSANQIVLTSFMYYNRQLSITVRAVL